MAYDKKYIGNTDKVKPYLDDREDRTEKAISGVISDINKINDNTKRETKYFAGSDFKNGWGNYNDYNGGYEQAMMTKTLNVVTIEGLIKPGSANTVATLPVGFRPRKRTVFPVYTSSGFKRLDIDQNGDITVEQHDMSFLSLSGITFLSQN